MEQKLDGQFNGWCIADADGLQFKSDATADAGDIDDDAVMLEW